MWKWPTSLVATSAKKSWVAVREGLSVNGVAVRSLT